MGRTLRVIGIAGHVELPLSNVTIENILDAYAEHPLNGDQDISRAEPCATVPGRAVVILVAGVVAAWFAAGSTGLLGHPLQHALTWLSLAVAVVAAWPDKHRSFGTWAILAIGAILGLVFTASSLPTVNVLAVAVVLAAMAQINRGLTARLALIAALGVMALGSFRFACASVPAVWLAADGLGWMLGRMAGWIAGSRLEVGATFGGIDFLVLTAAIYVAWLVYTGPPRLARALWAAAAIIIGHFAYLIVLANAEKLLAALPDMVVAPLSDVNNVGIWTWGNGLRSLIPWNLPLLAMAIDGAIVAVMVRGAWWLPIVELNPQQLQRQKEKEEKEEVPGSVLAADMLFRFGPALLAVAATLAGALAINHADLKGKTIVAYDKGYLNWLKPEYDSQTEGSYGMLPRLVESLGGKFVHSPDLSKDDLAAADILLLIHPDQPWPKDMLERVWDYVRGGGSLLLAAEPAIHEGQWASSFNDVLQPLAMQVRFDTAVTRTGNWEQSYDVLAHPATAGIDDLRNGFGVQLGSSIGARWPRGRCWRAGGDGAIRATNAATTGGPTYDAGKPLGDLVLAAEQPLGAGRVLVLGDTTPLHNEMLANSYPFAGRLLTYLAHRPSSPQALWRQLLALAALAAMLGLLAFRPAAWQLILTPSVMAVSLACCTATTSWSGRVLPDGRSNTPGGVNKIAYIDASHLEAYSGDCSDLSIKQGIAGLVRTLIRDGYLPLLAADLTPERLGRCGLLISIGPAREFSSGEREAVKHFVSTGGTLVCMVGAEEARTNASLLADFGFKIPASPVPPGEEAREPEPLGAFRQLFGEKRYIQFYAGWPVEGDSVSDQKCEKWVAWSDGKIERPIVISRSQQAGFVVVIGDTHLADNENLEGSHSAIPDNIRFWRWLLSRRWPGRRRGAHRPAAADAASAEGGAEPDDEGDAE